MLEEKGFVHELVTEFTYVLIMNGAHPLADHENIRYEDLKPYVEITHADPFLPSMSASATKKQSLLMTSKRGYSFLNVQVSLICCLKIPILLCGYLLHHKRSLNAMGWLRKNAPTTAESTTMCLFTEGIIILPILTGSS